MCSFSSPSLPFFSFPSPSLPPPPFSSPSLSFPPFPVWLPGLKFTVKKYWTEWLRAEFLDLFPISRENDSVFHLKYFIYFNWRLITLHYYSGFCQTLTWISHGCTCVSHPEPHLLPPSPSHPSGPSQCTGPERPVSCIEPGLKSGNFIVLVFFSLCCTIYS